MEIRLIKPHEYAEANNLYNNYYGRHRSLEEFIWEFVEGPLGPSIFVVAFEDNKIVGTHAVIPIYMVDTFGNRFLTGKSEEVLVLPDYRGGFTFLKIDDYLFKECAKKNIYYIWGLANLEVHHKLMKFENPFQAWQGVYVFNPIAAYHFLSKLNEGNTSKDLIKIAAFSLLSWFKGLKSVSYLKAELESINPSELLNEIHTKEHPIYYDLLLDADYISWRLINNPFSNNYKIIKYTKNNSTSWALINIKNNAFAYIEYIRISNQLTDIEKVQFMKTIIGTLKANKVSFIRYMGYNTNNYNKEQIRLFESAGGIFAKRGLKFWWKTLKNAPTQIDLQKIMMSRLYTQGNN